MDSFISSLNHCSGLIALIAAVLSFVSIIVTIAIFKYEKKRRRKEAIDEYNTLNEINSRQFTNFIDKADIELEVRKTLLKKKIDSGL